MMLRRQVDERLEALAGFVTWDPDPYLVLSKEGRMVWIVDGYLTSSAHPYSRSVSSEVFGEVNYVRNSVKATVDAYDGAVKIYVFDPQDPLVAAYRRLFPSLFTDAAQMPADLRAHTRVPEALFRVQAEMYRTYHMRDPESFYNRADLWDLPAVGGAAPTALPQGIPERFAERFARIEQSAGRYAPTYILAKLPGESQPEFLLTMPFVPHNKQNLIGMMAARCDGDKLGELVYVVLGRQEILPGPNQVEANISQDQTISKDLTLWNQQGSQVLRGQLLILPVDDTFLYVAPIYIQAKEAKMPQLKKIALVNGNTIVYRDTFTEAMGELKALGGGAPAPAGAKPALETRTEAPAAAGDDARLRQIRETFLRYKALMLQGKWSEAGKELETLESLLRR